MPTARLLFTLATVFLGVTSSVPAQTFEILFSEDVGIKPYSGLVQGSDGDFYGTSKYGGSNNLGTVFKISANGTHNVLYNFNLLKGVAPSASLVQGSDGAFYGTTEQGGAYSYGTVFKITSGGVHSLLHSFDDINGNAPYCRLVQGADGAFYGTTQKGGDMGN
jgi:uncharacterized repeat protein (TIGR03803 family)